MYVVVFSISNIKYLNKCSVGLVHDVFGNIGVEGLGLRAYMWMIVVMVLDVL